MFGIGLQQIQRKLIAFLLSDFLNALGSWDPTGSGQSDFGGKFSSTMLAGLVVLCWLSII